MERLFPYILITSKANFNLHGNPEYMKIYFDMFLFIWLIFSESASAANQKAITQKGQPAAIGELHQHCINSLMRLPGNFSKSDLGNACSQSRVLDSCYSVNGNPIYHFQPKAIPRAHQKRILVLGVMHGDEAEGGSVARRWMERLTRLKSRNKWRVIPILNPDGLKQKTRVNANGVDINRNFPSKNWNKLAHKYWVTKKNKDPRRNPGPSAASEPETLCTMRHIKEFAPHFIVAIHTPYGVLDFDGPKVKVPRFREIPWVSLGTFPGSLGRFMWNGQGTPVLTVELKGSKLLEQIERMDFLQDIAGTLAIRSSKNIRKR